MSLSELIEKASLEELENFRPPSPVFFRSKIKRHASFEPEIERQQVQISVDENNNIVYTVHNYLKPIGENKCSGNYITVPLQPTDSFI